MSATYSQYLKQEGEPQGRLEFWKIGDIKFVSRIQRDPCPITRKGDQSMRRMNALGHFSPNKAGVLRGAILSDGKDKGAKVLTDGLGRKTRCEMDFGVDYLLPVWVRDMTEVEAAEDFLEFNGSQKKPSPYDHYHVSEVVDAPEWATIRGALKKLGIEGVPTESGAAYGNGETPRVTAIAALKRIASNALREYHLALDKEDRDAADRSDFIPEATDRLASVFGVTRQAFPGQVGAHDADLLQAVARLYAINGDDLMEVPEVKSYLIDVLASATDVGIWRVWMVQEHKAVGGSVQRSVMLARLIGRAFNGKTKGPIEDNIPERPEDLPTLQVPIAAKKR